PLEEAPTGRLDLVAAGTGPDGFAAAYERGGQPLRYVGDAHGDVSPQMVSSFGRPIVEQPATPACPQCDEPGHNTANPGFTAREEGRRRGSMRGMSQPLDQAHVLLTGATGFVGQAVLEKLLSAYPTTRITVLVRPRGEITAQQRIEKLLRKPVFRPWREEVGEDAATAALAERVTVLSGDLGDLPPLPGDLDVVIHSASTVSFDLPVDEAFAANVSGPVSLYDALRDTGSDPHVVHVSTSYVAGLRKGVAEERTLDHHIDRNAELASALAARTAVEEDSRSPRVLGDLIGKAQAEHRRAGPQAVADAAEALRVEWVKDQLVEHGRTRARSLGWPDVYTFTKAMGERAAEELWAGAGH